MTLHRKSGCPDSLCHHLAGRDTQNPTGTLSAHRSTSCGDRQVRAPVRCQLSMATRLGFFQRIKTAFQDAPLFLPQRRCYIQLLPDGLLTLLDVGDLEQMNTFHSHATPGVDTHTLACTHTPVPEPCVCLPTVSDRESWLSGCSTTLSPHTPPGRVTLPSSGD